MTLPIKVVNFLINLIIIILTVIYPSETVAMAMVSVAISTATWAFVNYKDCQGFRRGISICSMICSAIMIGFCFIINFTCDLINIPDTSEWMYKFESEIAYLSGAEFPYYMFEVIVFVMILSLMIASFANPCDKLPSNSNLTETSEQTKCFHDMLDEQ